MENSEQYTVLIVDDNPDNISIQGGLLKNAGYRVVIALSGEEALICVERYKPDAILLDIMMPGVDGFETCSRIKEDPAQEHIPVIFVSAKDEISCIDRCFEAGGTDYLSKPIEPNILLARLKLHIIAGKALIQEKNAILKMDAIINVLDEGVIALDRQQNIEFVNKSATEILAMSEANILDMPIKALIKQIFPVLAEELLKILNEEYQGQTFNNIRTVYTNKNGDKFNLLITCSVITNQFGNNMGAVYIFKKMCL